MYSKHLKTIHSILSILIAFMLLAPQGAVARAAPASPTAGSLSLSPSTGSPGIRILVTGTFDQSGEKDIVNLWWDYINDGRYLGSTNLRPDGSFALPAIIPPEASLGNHQLIADVNYGYDQAIATFNVTQTRFKALYIYETDTDTAGAYKTLLDERNFVTTLVTLQALPEVSLSTYHVILVGHDTGSSRVWHGTAEDAKRLKASGKPVLGLGVGGATFFDVIGTNIGYLSSMIISNVTQMIAADPADLVWNKPYRIYLTEGQMTVFTQAVQGIGVYLPEQVPGVMQVGRDVQWSNYYELAREKGKYLLWGFDVGPNVLTYAGKDLFVNNLWNLVNAKNVDTLVLTDFQRMQDIGYAYADVVTLTNDLSNLIGLPKSSSNMTAIHRDLFTHGPASLLTARTNWDANENNLANTNAYVASVDSYIETFKQTSYPNLLYVIIVGAHEVIPQKPRPADDMDSPYRESEWANNLPQKSGYFYSLYHDTSDGKGFGHYFTDSVYSDLSYINNGRGADNVLIPELAVGRLVETPAQISVLVTNYIASSGTLSRTDMASIGSHDYMDGAQQAANNMGASADTGLIQNSFNSSLVPPKINANPDIIYIAGHGNYNWTTTGSGQGFMAGSTAAQGDTEELNNLPDAVIVASGCHNGVNFGNRLYHDYTGNTDYGEFPERYANKQVGVYLGSTGYTWISASGSSSNAALTGWSEKLATHFVKHLLNDGVSATVGKAYKSAVNEYVSDYGTITDEHRRVISIANLYGIPNYRWPGLVYISPIHIYKYWIHTVWIVWPGAAVNQTSVSAPQQLADIASQEITYQSNQWSVDPDGSINIPGASYTGSSDEPIMPIVEVSQILPAGSHAVNVTFDEAGSENVTIPNDLPLASMAVLTTTVPNTFDFAGFYPPTPYYTTTLTTLGGEGQQIDFSIIPVQYDATTHQTRIWTRMHFIVEYDVDPEALVQDTDADGLPDYWEASYGLDPNSAVGDQGATGDPDQDGLTNTQEHDPTVGTNPMDADTDNDGYSDGMEVNFGSDPLNPGSWPNYMYLPVINR